MNKSILINTAAAISVGTCLHVAAAGLPIADARALGAGVEQYLSGSGQLCVGKYDWPITVTPQDVESGHRNAVQLPAMAQAGLVAATPTADGAVIYKLTEAGLRHYQPRQVKRRNGEPGMETVRDFCAGSLKLDKVVRWTAPVKVGDTYESVATYTYTIDAADWTTDRRLREVFPMIVRVVDGQRRAELMQRMRLVDGRWQAVASVE